MGRYSGGGSGGSVSGWWIALWVVYLFLFLVVLPPVMGCTGICDSINANSILYLWYFIWTLGLNVTWMQMTMGVFAFLLVVGALNMIS